ncbi:alpha/beta hydrolase [Halobacteriales archaeon QS_3_64_16]|nr:MAG: alpha/beta hydrolase [Halobacteriales archaeon QS_3_64_16]
MNADVTDRSAVVDGHRLHYLTAGEAEPGRTILFLHGGIIDAAHLSWGAAIDTLAENHRVIGLDMLGYGASAIPDIEYTTVLHVDTVEEFLDAIGVDRPTVLGTSLGGGVALGLALQAPEKIDGLVLADSFGLGRELPNGDLSYALARLPVLNKLSITLLRRNKGLARASLGGIVEDPSSIPDALVDDFYTQLQRPGVGRAFRRWRANEVTRAGYRTVYVDRLEEIDHPTLVLHGGEDDLFPPRWAKRAADRLPNADLRIFEDCGHWLPREKPAECNDAIAAFLRDG